MLLAIPGKVTELGTKRKGKLLKGQVEQSVANTLCIDPPCHMYIHHSIVHVLTEVAKLVPLNLSISVERQGDTTTSQMAE